MDILSIAHEIVRTYPQLMAGEVSPLSALINTLPQEPSPVYRATWLGARMLGFLPHDADCIARAWQSQSQRKQKFELSDWPCALEDYSVQAPGSGVPFAACPQSLGLYAVLPDANWVARLVELQVPTVQLRFKSNDNKAIAREVKAAVKATEHSNTLLFINDHWEQAIDSGAYGVHLGQEDMDEAPLDKIRSAGLRLGLSSHGYAEMLKAYAVAPSYLALGAVFPTTLKRMATAPQGLGRLAMYAKLMSHQSLVAIGGIDLEKLPSVMATGVGSAAFVRAITAASHVSEAVAQLTRTLHSHRIEPSSQSH